MTAISYFLLYGNHANKQTDKHPPFNIWVLRYNISLQSFHKVFVISCPVKLFHFFLLDISFVLESTHKPLLLFPECKACGLFSARQKTGITGLGMAVGKQAACGYCLINNANSDV